MTWNERRKNWVGRSRGPDPAPAPEKKPAAPVPVIERALVVPGFPVFSPAAIAELLGINRGTVHYYLEHGKLPFFRDNINERYVMREELVRFIREYLGMSVHE